LVNNLNKNIMATKMTKQDLQWQAESDARTMANYQEILGDKARMNRAIKEANKQARDLSKRASVMQNAAKVKTTKTTTGRKK
jgi:hypothetical protein